VTGALIEYTLARLNLFLDMELLAFDDNGIRLEPERLESGEAPDQHVPGREPHGS